MAAGGDAWPSKNLDEEVANYLLFVGSIDRTLGVQVAARSQEGDGCRITLPVGLRVGLTPRPLEQISILSHGRLPSFLLTSGILVFELGAIFDERPTMGVSEWLVFMP